MVGVLSCSLRDSDTNRMAVYEEHTNLEDRLKCIEDSLATLGGQVNELYFKTTLNSSAHDVDALAQLENVATRVDRMELLLLRMPLEDFKVLDSAIATLLPTSPTTSHSRMSEAHDKDVADVERVPVKEAREKEVHVSINPDYLQQLCMDDEADEKIDEIHIDSVEARGQDQIRPLHCLDAGGLESLEDSFSDEGDDMLLSDGRLEELVARVKSGDLELEDLTESEAKCFHSELTKGSLSCSWSSWHPWWHRPEVDEAQDGAVASSTRSVATRINPPAHICCARGRQPHVSVAFTSWSALYAYVHTMRASNGGWEWAPLEAAPNILHLCPAISSHQVYNTADECLKASLEAAATLPHGGFGVDFDLLCLADVRSLIGAGPHCCAVAVQDIADIFAASLAAGGDIRCGELRRGMKKLNFLTSFAFHHFELLQALAEMD